MMTATQICFVGYKPYMAIISYLKHFLKIFTFEKNLNFCSENLLHLFSPLLPNVPLSNVVSCKRRCKSKSQKALRAAVVALIRSCGLWGYQFGRNFWKSWWRRRWRHVIIILTGFGNYCPKILNDKNEVKFKVSHRYVDNFGLNFENWNSHVPKSKPCLKILGKKAFRFFFALCSTLLNFFM